MYLLLQVHQEMIVVNKKNQNRTIDLQDFYEVKGLLRSTNYPRFGQEAVGIGAIFEWKKDHGVINGTDYQMNRINEIFNEPENLAFANFKIMKKLDYDHDKCTTPFQNPCPYYHTAFSSLMIPTALALLSFLVMTCCSCCTCCCMQGM